MIKYTFSTLLLVCFVKVSDMEDGFKNTIGKFLNINVYHITNLQYISCMNRYMMAEKCRSCEYNQVPGYSFLRKFH